MIGRALRVDIEIYAGRIDQNPIFAATLAGRMTRAMVAQYMVGLRYVLAETIPCLVRAAERSRELADERLETFFRQRVTEEVGHDVWADNDLKKLRTTASVSDEVPEAAKVVIAHNRALIEKNPALWLAYIAFVEYFTVVKGPEWLVLLEDRCGIPRAAMTAVGNHVELDREHAEEVFGLIDDLVVDPKMLAPMREALSSSIEKFDAYCADIVTPVAIGSSTHAIDAAAHVSAA